MKVRLTMRAVARGRTKDAVIQFWKSDYLAVRLQKKLLLELQSYFGDQFEEVQLSICPMENDAKTVRGINKAPR